MNALKNEKPEIIIQTLHRSAMSHSDNGDMATRKGNHDEAKESFVLAYLLEKQAADMLINSTLKESEIEPSRSILCVSAASLAMTLEKYADLAANAKLKKEHYAKQVIKFNFAADLVEDAIELIK